MPLPISCPPRHTPSHPYEAGSPPCAPESPLSSLLPLAKSAVLSLQASRTVYSGRRTTTRQHHMDRASPPLPVSGWGPYDKWHMSFCQERRVGQWCMTPLKRKSTLWHGAALHRDLVSELWNEFSDVSSAYLGQADGRPGEITLLSSPCPSDGKGGGKKKKKKTRLCHWIPAKGHTRVKVPSSHTPRVIKKCDFGGKKKEKKWSGVRLVLLFIYFFMAKGWHKSKIKISMFEVIVRSLTSA